MLLHVKQIFSVKGAQQEEGQGLIEYALIILLISIAVIVVLGLLGGQIDNVFNNITTILGNGI